MVTYNFKAIAFRDTKATSFRNVNLQIVTSDELQVAYSVLRKDKAGIVHGLLTELDGEILQVLVNGRVVDPSDMIAARLTWGGKSANILGWDNVNGETVFFQMGGAALPRFASKNAFFSFFDSARVSTPSGTYAPGASLDLARFLSLASKTDNDSLTMRESSGEASAVTGRGNDKVIGNSFHNYIDLGEGNDRAYGGAGSDDMYGNTGNDTIIGGVGDDNINGGQGSDLLFGGTDNDNINGGRDADSIDGGLGNDYLSGDPGDDTLVAGGGDDTLNGWDGADVFIFDAAAGPSFATIEGFESIDAIRIDGVIANDTVFVQTGDNVTISFGLDFSIEVINASRQIVEDAVVFI